MNDPHDQSSPSPTGPAQSASQSTPPEPEKMIPLSAALPLIGYVHDCLQRSVDGHEDRRERIIDPRFLATFDHMVEGSGYRTSTQMFDGLRRAGFVTLQSSARKQT